MTLYTEAMGIMVLILYLGHAGVCRSAAWQMRLVLAARRLFDIRRCRFATRKIRQWNPELLLHKSKQKSPKPTIPNPI